MSTRTARKVFGTVVAALTLTLVTNVAPAQASTTTTLSTKTTTSSGIVTTQRRDSGWDIP
jgi:hypothetical protein